MFIKTINLFLISVFIFSCSLGVNNNLNPNYFLQIETPKNKYDTLLNFELQKDNKLNQNYNKIFFLKANVNFTSYETLTLKGLTPLNKMSGVLSYKLIKENNINVEICDIGDRKVMEKMDCLSASLGGENSGHVIYSNFLKTGDGLITALQLINTFKVNKKRISELTNNMELYPQVIVNVPVTNKPNLQELIPFREKIKWANNLLDNKGRILVRYSGTESICRIMVEGENLNHVNIIANDVSEWIKSNIK